MSDSSMGIGGAPHREAPAQAGEPEAPNRIWFDTEFIEDGRTIDLLSIGLVRQDGATYYAEPEEADRSRASDWVKENVIPHLTGSVKPRAVIAREIVEFAGDEPEFWAYYADYDWVALCQLFGTMLDLPKGWPMFCRDVQQVRATLGVKTLPPQSSTEHHALADAIWTKEAHAYLSSLYTDPAPAQEPVAVPAGERDKMVANLISIADAGRRADGSDIPLGETLRKAAAMLAAAPVSPPAESGEVERLIADAWDRLLNVDDRTSPEEYPNMGLIEFDELAGFMREVALACTPAPQPGAVCPACSGSGRIGSMVRFGDGEVDGLEEPCPDCSPAPQPDTRPINCRNRLEDEGKPHPKSGCNVEGCRGVFGAICEAPQPDEPVSDPYKLDAHAPQPGGAVKVKALEWNPVPWARGALTAQCSVGRYELSRTFDGLIASLHSAEMHHIGEGGEDHLKALCQADFERRVNADLLPVSEEA